MAIHVLSPRNITSFTESLTKRYKLITLFFITKCDNLLQDK